MNRWYFFVVHSAIALVAVLIIGFAVPPAYHAIRMMKVDGILEDAKSAAREEDWATARNNARSVLLARPGDFEAFRLWCRALSEIGEPRAYIVTADLFMHPSATREDRLFALGVLARQGPEAVALSAYASLEEAMREEPAALAAISPLLVRRGEVSLVEKVLREAPSADPAIRLELLRALCSIPTSERIEEARSLFAGLIKSDDSEPALEALLILGDTPSGLAKGAPLPPLAPWVQSQSRATTLHHLLALHPAIDEAAGAKDAIIQKAIDRFLGVDPGSLGTWLIRHERSALAADLLAESAVYSPTAFIARLHALLREKRSEDVVELLAAPPDACDLVDLELAKVAAARMTGDPIAEGNAWSRALNNAAYDQSRNRFLEIGRYAESVGNRDVIDDSWVAAIRIGWGPIPLYQDLRPLFVSLGTRGRSEDLLAICRTLLRFEPWNAELINNYNYLALLHDVIIPAEAVKAVESIIAANPDVVEFRSSLALALLMADQPQKALEQIAVLRQSKRVPPLMIQALEGTARVLVGETEVGTATLAGINWRAFMRAESFAFRRLLTRDEVKDLPVLLLPQIEAAEDPEQTPAWKRAVERLEKARATDVLPALPKPIVPSMEPAEPSE